MSAGKRAHPRVSTRLTATLTLPDGKRQVASEIRNMSMGGVYVECAEAPPFGAELGIHFSLPDPPYVVRCRGVVVHKRRPGDRAAAAPIGIGIRLLDIDPPAMKSLAAFIERHLGTRHSENEQEQP